MTKTIQYQLDELALSISANLWGKAKSWGGAGVIIRKKERLSDGEINALVVVSVYANELSWMLTRLRDIGAQYDGFSIWKKAYFQRLAYAASLVPKVENVDILLFTCLREAYQFFGENELRQAAENWAPVFNLNEILIEETRRFEKDSVIKFFNKRHISV
jgi:hypothetical protein